MNAIATQSPELSIIDGVPTTTSTDVARHFGKQHRHVIEAVERLLPQLPAEALPNFRQGVYVLPETGDQQHKMYRLTRDGFTLLAMGFTGKKALTFKLAYIDAFNKMEASLQCPPALPCTISPAQQQHLQELVHLVAESGVQNYAETWARFHRKFKVPGYKDLPAARFDDAVAYLKGKMSDTDTMAMVQRHMGARVEAIVNSVSVIAGSVVQQAVAQLLHQPSSARMVFGIGYDRAGNPTPIVQAVRDDQCVMSVPEMLKRIRDEPVTLSPADIAKTIGSLQDVLVRMASRPALA